MTPTVQNLFVLLLLALTGWAAVAAWRREDWRETLTYVGQRRWLSCLVLGGFLVVGLLDAITWRGDSSADANAVTQLQPRSVIDRLFGETREKSYSAPLATREFYGQAPLKHPGAHLLGTDILGRDVLHQVLKGARIALLIGGLTSLIALPIGLFIGMTAGYFGRWWDDLVFFFTSVLSSIPGILLLISIVTVLGRSLTSVVVALAFTGWVGFCRVVRGETMKLREMDYVFAARALGVSEIRILWRHILPNLLPLLVITFMLMFSGLILVESTLAWLNLGAEGSWGSLIAQARDELQRDPVVWWTLASAGIALFALLMAMNLIGDTLRDALDPRRKRRSP